MKCKQPFLTSNMLPPSIIEEECGGEMIEVGYMGEKSKLDDFDNKIVYKIKLYQCETCKTIKLC